MSETHTRKAKEIEVVMVAAVRSPFVPAKNGELSDMRADDILAQTVQGLLDKTGVDPSLIEDLKVGTAFPEGEQGMNIARNAGLMTSLPETVPGVTTNRFCGSSMETIHNAAGDIMMGKADAVIAAGVETMSGIPMGGFNFSPNPDLYELFPDAYMPMGETAEVVADRYNVSRDLQEEFAVASHKKAVIARDAGILKDEIIPIKKKNGSVVSLDGCIRPDTTKEALASLKTSFKKAGTVTAGTSSPLTNGASATLITSRDFAEKHGLPILGKIIAVSTTGLAPDEMGMGPVSASLKALEKANLTIDDIGVFEVNEAFASQSVAVKKALGIPDEKLNKDGGAISMGHALGASGARITGKAGQIAKREGERYSLATMCVGGGQGMATIMENLDVASKDKVGLTNNAATVDAEQDPSGKVVVTDKVLKIIELAAKSKRPVHSASKAPKNKK